MTPLLVSFELKEHYLLVLGHGKRDNLASMVEASRLIFEKIHETKATRLLVDYRKLEVNVKMSEAFNIVKRYETANADMKGVFIAAVFSENNMEFGRYWTEISRQRGFAVEVFEDVEAAEMWLMEQNLSESDP